MKLGPQCLALEEISTGGSRYTRGVAFMLIENA
jgi:hypothetical protein